jgi:hypothetical protein
MAVRVISSAWPRQIPANLASCPGPTPSCQRGSRHSRPPDREQSDGDVATASLAHEAVAVLGTAGLDPAVGFLHQARWGRPSLALDLMEEFRPLVVDAVVFRCLATGDRPVRGI